MFRKLITDRAKQLTRELRSALPDASVRVARILQTLREGGPILGPSVPSTPVYAIADSSFAHGSPAFALGDHAFVCDTLLRRLDDSGIAFCIAHELAHVLHGDSFRITWHNRHFIELRADRLADRWCRASGYTEGAASAMGYLTRWQWDFDRLAVFVPVDEPPLTRWLRRRLESHPRLAERATALRVEMPALEPALELRHPCR